MIETAGTGSTDGAKEATRGAMAPWARGTTLGVPVVPLVKRTTASSVGAGRFRLMAWCLIAWCLIACCLRASCRRAPTVGEQGGRSEHRVDPGFGRHGGVGGPGDAGPRRPGRFHQERQFGPGQARVHQGGGGAEVRGTDQGGHREHAGVVNERYPPAARDPGRPQSGGCLPGGRGQAAEAGGLPGDDQRSTVGVDRHDIVEDAANRLPLHGHRPFIATDSVMLPADQKMPLPLTRRDRSSPASRSRW
jgi:hypothetical protein